MVVLDGPGADSVALVCIGTACERCTGITRVAGGACDLTGICTGATITTRGRVGSGVASVGLAVTCTAIVFSSDGMVHAGTECVAIGICGAETITTTASMAGHSGVGAASGELEFTGIDCEHFTATTRAIGVVCARIGTCGSATITTSRAVGSGAIIAA